MAKTKKKSSALKVYRVRYAEIWSEDWTASNRDEAGDRMVDYINGERPTPHRTQTTTYLLREATPEEAAEYWGDTAQGDEKNT